MLIRPCVSLVLAAALFAAACTGESTVSELPDGAHPVGTAPSFIPDGAEPLYTVHDLVPTAEQIERLLVGSSRFGVSPLEWVTQHGTNSPAAAFFSGNEACVAVYDLDDDIGDLTCSALSSNLVVQRTSARIGIFDPAGRARYAVNESAGFYQVAHDGLFVVPGTMNDGAIEVLDGDGALIGTVP